MINLESLSQGQKDVVLKTEGPLMVLAGAGSGKTRTLVARIVYLLENLKVSPFQVLALTFSNKAAREMRERISSEANLDLGALQVTTFHSFCAKVLRTEANYLGLSRNFTIYDQTESKAVIKNILGRKGISLKELPPSEILYFIEGLKNNGHYIDREDSISDLDKKDEYFPYFEEYEREVHKANACDFGGLITGTLELFEKYPAVLETYKNRFQYILVDEYQDTNRAQFELVKHLANEKKNICVVGDEDQSIYSWRGADIRNILEFEKVFNDAEVLKLEQNYRSSKNIIEAASCVISQNKMRKGKEMWTENERGDSVQIVELKNDKDEANFVSTEIKGLIESKDEKVLYRDIAVFYRANSQSRIIEDYLRSNNIPYRVVGGTKFYERKEIKDLLSYLRLIVNDKDSLALSRIINTPSRGIGSVTLRKFEEEAIRTGSSLWETIEGFVKNSEDYFHLKISQKVKSSIGEFVNMIQEGKDLNQSKVCPSDIFEKVLHDSGYLSFLKSSKDYESLARVENLEELVNAIKQFESGQSTPTLLGFLETITLDGSSEEKVEEKKNLGEISLMTIHGSKGLEFNYVFLVGSEENIFPSFMSLENGDLGLEEERRLFYVAMTRAMKKLHICFAQGRMLHGLMRFNGPSRFIYEIPEQFYFWRKKTGHASEEGPEYADLGDTDFSDREYDEEKVYQVGEFPSDFEKKRKQSSKFPKGVKVLHSLYGEGLVIDNQGFGSEEKVVIEFPGGERKKFMVKFAPLKKI